MSSRAKDTGFLRNLVTYDVNGNITLPSNLVIFGTKEVATKEYVDAQNSGQVLQSRTLTINGTTYDLSANRSWTINSMVYPASGIALSSGTGWDTSIPNNSSNWNTAYGWGNHALAGYLTSFTESDPTVGSHIKAITTTNISNWGLAYSWGNHGVAGYESASNKSNNASLGNSSILYPTQAAVKSYVDSAVTGGMNIQGDWNASTNTPNISTTTTTGFTWRVSVSGSTNIGGITSWNVNDLAVKTASGWIKIDNSTAVTSIFGRQGVVVANTGDYNTSQVTESGNLYFTTARARASFSAGSNISIDANGIISCSYSYSLPTASATTLGGVKIGTGVNITAGVISVSTNYEAPIAAGTTAQYWRGDKTWQTLPVYTLSGLGGLPLSGGTMTGAIVLKEGSGNGLKFPNDVFGGSGDTAGMRLITRAGESMSLEMYLTNDADDWFNISVPSDNGAKVNGNTIWHSANLTNLNQLSNGPGYITSLSGAVLTTYNTSLNSDSRNSRGVTRLYRRDDDSDYSVQTYWTGTYWRLYGYNGDSAHADVQVGYSDSAGYATNGRYSYDNGANGGSVQWKEPSQLYVYYARYAGSIEWSQVVYRPTALSQFTNDSGFITGSYLPLTGGTVTGSITATAFYESSDIRYKNVIETNPSISGLGIDVIKFTRQNDDKVRYGYSAQQVMAVIPEAVEGTDNLVVNYMDVHTIKIASLERRVAELEAKLKSTL